MEIGAARTFLLLISFLIVSDLDFKGKTKYIKDANARREIYENECELFRKVDEVLHVYTKGTKDEIAYLKRK